MNNWTNPPENYNDYIGFVYKIVDVDNNKQYIGQKTFWTIHKKTIKIKPNKNELEILNKYKINKSDKYKSYKEILKNKYKNKYKRIWIKKETDWKVYWSSSPIINDKIKNEGTDGFVKSIIHLCKTKSELSIKETYEQIKFYMNGSWDLLYNEVINLRVRVRKNE